MIRTDDPVADFLRHDRQQQEELKRRPICADCDEHIQEEFCYEFNGEYICERCLEDLHKKTTKDCIN